MFVCAVISERHKRNVFLSHYSRMCLASFEFYTYFERSLHVFVICNKKDINLWRRVHKEWFRVSESHTFSFLRSLSFFFFCLRTIKFFSRLSKLYYSCVFLGDFSTCGVHVREGFCEKGVYFNEHNNTTRCFKTKKKSREKKLCLVSSFFVVT